MNPFISIIIPFFGAADKALLQRCVNSIHEQGMEEGSYEIIIATDSKETTGGARNNGMRQAQGEYILFVDVDDMLLPDTLLSCLPVLKQYVPDILKFDFLRFSGQFPARRDRLSESLLPYVEYPSGNDYMFSNNFLGVIWGHFFCRDYLEVNQVCFHETSYYDDEEFIAKAYLYSGKMIVTPWKGYAYYHSPSSLTQVFTEEKYQLRISAFKEMLFRLKTFKTTSCSHHALDVKSKALNRRIHFLTIDYIRQMRRNKCTIKEINQRLAILKQEGFLPLPSEGYSWKYRLVAPVINIYTHLFI